MRRQALAAVAAAAAVLSLAACGSGSQAGTSASQAPAPTSTAASSGTPSSAAAAPATAGGSITIACSQTAAFCQKITAAFSKDTGIKADYVNLGAGAVLARLDATKGNPEFDVWSGGQSENHLIASDRGYVEPYKSPDAVGLPPQYNDTEGRWSGFYTDSLAFCSNSKELDKLGLKTPTSWSDLLNPKLKGLVSFPNPATVGTGYMAIWTEYVLNNEDASATMGYFKKLNSNILQYTSAAAAGGLLAGQGQVAVSVMLDSDCVTSKLGGLKDLVLSYPSEGTGFEVGAVSVLKGAKNPDAAKKYMDWVLTPQAQDLYPSVPSYAVPTNPKATLGPDTPNQSTIKHVDWDAAQSAAKRADLIKLFQTEVSAG